MVYTDASKEAMMKYRKKSLHRVELLFQNEEYNQIKDAADRSGLPVSSYIKKLIRDNAPAESQDRKKAKKKQGLK